jgi:hypothetical protein
MTSLSGELLVLLIASVVFWVIVGFIVRKQKRSGKFDGE